MSERPTLILTGPPGVGKSTAAAVLADRAEAGVHLESDVFFRFIRGGHVEPWKPESHEQNGAVMKSVGAAAAAYANAGYFVVIDGIVLPRWFLAPLRDVLREAGHDVAYTVLRAPLEVCARRVERREGMQPPEPEVVLNMWSQFEDLGEFEGHSVDIGDRTAHEVADQVEDLLAGGSHLVQARDAR